MKNLFILITLIITGLVLLLRCEAAENILYSAELSYPDDKGNWTEAKNCLPGFYITGYKIRANEQGYMASLSVICSYISPEYTFIPATIVTVGDDEEELETEGGAEAALDLSGFVNSTTHAIGLATPVWEDSEGNDIIGQSGLIFFDEKKFNPEFPANATSVQINQFRCTQGFGLCAVVAELSDGEEGLIEPHISRLTFRCCYICIPEVKKKVIHQMRASGTESETGSLEVSIGLALQEVTMEDGDAEVGPGNEADELDESSDDDAPGRFRRQVSSNEVDETGGTAEPASITQQSRLLIPVYPAYSTFGYAVQVVPTFFEAVNSTLGSDDDEDYDSNNNNDNRFRRQASREPGEDDDNEIVGEADETNYPKWMLEDPLLTTMWEDAKHLFNNLHDQTHPGDSKGPWDNLSEGDLLNEAYDMICDHQKICSVVQTVAQCGIFQVRTNKLDIEESSVENEELE